jgi:hypothetical protein
MKITSINIPAAGTRARDCELLSLSDCRGFTLNYRKDEDNTFWSMRHQGIIAYKVISEEFARNGYLTKLPVNGSFFEVLDSPWIDEFGKDQAEILSKCKHYVFRFYDETIDPDCYQTC